MGFFKNLLEIFNKNIECGCEIDDHIVYFLKKKKYLYLNKNIFVREKNACVVVYDGKVCDVILEGKYKINQDSIPETYGRAKIEKQESQGVKIKRIRADLYFVNLNDFKQFSFLSDSPFKAKSSIGGKVKGCLAGTCVCKVFDPGSLIKMLIARTGKISTKNILPRIRLMIGNKINYLIQKQKIPVELLLNNQEYVESLVNTDIQDALDKEGLFVSNVKLKAIEFTKKNKKKLNKYLSSRPNAVNRVTINSDIGIGNVNKVSVAVPSGNRAVPKNNIMQRTQSVSTYQQFLECKKCHKKNGLNARICINCGHKLP